MADRARPVPSEGTGAARSVPFQIMAQSLAPGQTLIEASAGTGKTYNIQHLVLRLLLENTPHSDGTRPCTVDEILIVTFTEAATAELRERVLHNLTAARRLLLEQPQALQTLSAAPAQIDPTLWSVLRAACAAVGPGACLERVQSAIRGFDEAGISTIHGFCQRILRENAFESGARFETELVTDDGELLRQWVTDFWRRETYEMTASEIAILQAHKLSLASLLHLARFVKARSGIVCEPDLAQTPVDLQAALALVLRHPRETLHAELEQAVNRKKLNKGFRDAWVERWAALWERGDCSAAAFFSRENIHSFIARRAPVMTPSNALEAFAEDCERLQQTADAWCGALRQRLVHRLCRDRELQTLKALNGVQSFDDLLLLAHQALQDESGKPNPQSALARRIRERFAVVLIDEFQDTDPIQFDIFRTIFGEEQRTMFMIGDPKQSIYCFRGADIFAYLDAAQQAERRTLTQNFRSHPNLLEAVNSVFCAQDNRVPFLFDAIRYEPVEAGRTATRRVLVDGEPDDGRPLRIWWQTGGPLDIQQAEPLVIRQTAEHIARLLKTSRTTPPTSCFLLEQDETNADGQTMVPAGSRLPIRPDHIAVLVATNAHATLIHQALLARNVPAVISKSGSLFACDEAVELWHLLAALAHPSDLRRCLTALAMPAIGLDVATLTAYREDPSRLQELDWWLGVLESHHRRWRRDGFMPMFMRFLTPEPRHGRPCDDPRLDKNVRANLARLPRGERRLTNLLHLAEVLHQEAGRRRLDPESLLRWFEQQIDSNGRASDDEECVLRLERDDAAVRIMTVHRSKGLEFPIVYCPFLWKRPKAREPYAYHPAAADDSLANRSELRLPLTEAAAKKAASLAANEALAENLRLAYVALTRAKYRCYAIAGEIKDYEFSALHHLLGDDPHSAASLPGVGVETREPSEEPATTTVLPRPTRDELALSARQLTRPVPAEWGVVSFTRLKASERHEDSDDENVRADEHAEAPRQDPNQFPKGPLTGCCLHEILEQLPYERVTGNTPEWRHEGDLQKILVDALHRHDRIGLSPAHPHYEARLTLRTRQVADLVHAALTTQLPDPHGSFCLHETSADERAVEMEFHYPLANRIDAGKLNDFLKRRGLQSYREAPEALLESLEIRLRPRGPRRGFMYGLLDLVFHRAGRWYLLDWKSNDLSGEADGYSRSGVLHAMNRHGYLLQFYIYTVALHRFLQKTLNGYDYDTHMGGGYYLFLRGLKAGTDNGVFFDRPSRQDVDELTAALGGEA